MFAWKHTHGIPRDKYPAPARPGTVSLETFAASENFLSFIVPGFAIPAARDTRNTAIVLIVVSWQCRILWTCWMSKTFANCNLNWAVPRWENRILWLGIWENFVYFRRTLEVSNKCRDSNLAWLKFRAYKYCNECHEVFFKNLLRWWFKMCLSISYTRMFRWNGDLKSAFWISNAVNTISCRDDFGSTFPLEFSKAITSTTALKFDFYDIL